MEPTPGKIAYTDFAKLDLRVATILEAARIEGATKLYKVALSVGEFGIRTVAAGIAEFYSPEELKGRKVILLANLEPKMLRGVESNGMLLAADVEGRAVLLMPDADVPEGSKVM